jgi:hypothetical protein
MKKHARRLTLNRETLLRLDETTLRKLKGGGFEIAQDSQAPACYSPWCGPTAGTVCETQTA